MNVLHRNKAVVCIASVIFILGITAGVAIPLPSETASSQIDGQQYHHESARGYFTNNIEVIGINALGMILFGMTAVMNLAVNGIILGATVKETLLSLGPAGTAAFFLPHGIFEIPAIILSGSVGLKVLVNMLLYLTERKEEMISQIDVKDSATLLLAALLMVGIAAVIEAHVTPVIGSYVVSTVCPECSN